MNRRNWIGIGAAYAKPIKCSQWAAAIVVIYEAFGIALFKPLSRILQLKKPEGIRSFYYFWEGFVRGMKQPVECETILYCNIGSGFKP